MKAKQKTLKNRLSPTKKTFINSFESERTVNPFVNLSAIKVRKELNLLGKVTIFFLYTIVVTFFITNNYKTKLKNLVLNLENQNTELENKLDELIQKTPKQNLNIPNNVDYHRVSRIIKSELDLYKNKFTKEIASKDFEILKLNKKIKVLSLMDISNDITNDINLKNKQQIKKTIPYSYANLLVFEYQNKLNRNILKNKHELVEKEFLSTFDLSMEANKIRYQALKKKQKIQLYSLKIKQREEERSFRKNNYRLAYKKNEF